MSATDYALQRFEEDRYLDEIALDAIDFILSAFDDKVEDNWLSTLEIPYSVDIAFEKIRKMMELATLEHDGNFLSASEDLEYLHPDGEPSASAIDAWARGSGL